MTLILPFVFLSCQSPPLKQREVVKKVEPPKRSGVTIAITGDISAWQMTRCQMEINRIRKYPLVFTDEWKSEYLIYVAKRGKGYLLKLWKGKKLIQTARALAPYEVPLAAAAITRQQIPDEPMKEESKISAATQNQDSFRFASYP